MSVSSQSLHMSGLPLFSASKTLQRSLNLAQRRLMFDLFLGVFVPYFCSDSSHVVSEFLFLI